MSVSLSTLISGSAFGAALLSSGVSDPRIILGQLNLTDNRMLAVFLTGSSISAISIYLVQRMHNVQLRPKASIRISRIGYAGNVLGGLMQGAGMALSGACPGTVLVQASQGLQSGQYALLGSFLGGAIYSLLKRLKSTGLSQPSEPSPSLAQTLHIKPGSALLIYLSICAAIVRLCLTSASPNSANLHKWPLHPLLGGLAIGIAQLVSLLLRGTSVGVSSVFGDVAEAFIGLFNPRRNKDGSITTDTSKASRPSILSPFFTPSTQFAIGLVLGSLALSFFYPSLSLSDSMRTTLDPGALQAMGVSAYSAILGGMFMTFGARLASGCSSGHGLSGTAQGAISSFVTTAAMLGGGIGVMKVLCG